MLRLSVHKASETARRGAGAASDERTRIKALELENLELRRANGIHAQGIGVFRTNGAGPPKAQMVAFIDDHREVY